ncbi:MAG: MFS transporter [Elusimicrobiaceae bacterium]|nr:MFS transporter [Elusimicrobiaceae bacterium]
MRLPHVLRALKHRNYRIFMGGQAVSLTGTWMQQLALSWLIYRMTGSAFLLGAVGFIGQLPTFILAPIAGVMADRYDKRKILLQVQTVAMLHAFLLAALVLSGTIQVWHIMCLGMVLGLVNAFDMPVRQAYVVEMLGGKQDLSNAIALNSSIVNVTRIIGPALAGVIVAKFGEGLCFLFNGISFIAVLWSLRALDTVPPERKHATKKVLSELREGLRYLTATPPLLHIILLLGAISLFGMSFQVLLPVYVKEVLGTGPRTLGLLMGAMGAGSLVAAAGFAAQKSTANFMALIPGAAAVFGTSLAAIAVAGSCHSALLIIPITGMAMMTQIAASNTTLQTISQDHMRGRVMAFYSMSFLGLAPFGSLYAGTMAQKIGVKYTLLIGGLICLAAGRIFKNRINALEKAGRLSPLPEKLPPGNKLAEYPPEDPQEPAL